MDLPEWAQPPADAEELRTRLEVVGLAQFSDALVQLARPSCRLMPDGACGGVGISRLGGLPDLSEATAWPHGPNGPLSFVAQLDLADVAAVLDADELPDSGLLSFFYDAVEQSAWGFDPADASSWAVVHTPCDAVISPRPWPDALVEEGRLGAVGLSLTKELTFPPATSLDVERLGIESAWETYGRVLGEDEDDELISRLLGHPQPVQGDMQVKSQLASNGIYCGGGNYFERSEARDLIPGSDRWRLLLQVDSHDELGTMWGDVGRLYFWITEEDLRARDWANTWMVLQCS